MRLTARLALHTALATGVGIAAVFALAAGLLVGQVRDAEGREARARLDGVAQEVEADRASLALSAAAIGQVATALFAGGTATGNATSANDTALAVALFQAHDIDAVYFAWDPAIDVSALMAQQPQPAAPTPFVLRDGIAGFRLAANGSLVPTAAPLDDALRAHRLDLQAPFTLASDILPAGGRVWTYGSIGLGGLLQPELGSWSLITVRELDATYVAELSLASGVDVHLHPVGAGWSADEVRVHRPSLATLVASAAVADASGQPVIVLESHQPRETLDQTLASMAFFLLAILAVCGVLLAIALVLLHRKVSGPLVALESRMHKVAAAASPGHAAPVRHGDDEVRSLGLQFDAMLAALEDRTRQLEDSNEALRSFAGVVSHDLKNPLSTFKVNLHLLAKQAEASGDAKDGERIARMVSSADRMEARIDGILAYAHARGEAQALRPVPLGPLVDGVLQDLAADVQRHGAIVQVGTLPTVRGEPAGLAQVVQNLVANALKFHKPGQTPRVRIGAQRETAGWAVHVEDDGVGFTPHEAASLFRPFARLGNAAHVAGQGIGLASCARIAGRMGGHLEAHGEPGVGARFTLHLPDGAEAPSGA